MRNRPMLGFSNLEIPTAERRHLGERMAEGIDLVSVARQRKRVLISEVKHSSPYRASCSRPRQRDFGWRSAPSGHSWLEEGRVHARRGLVLSHQSIDQNAVPCVFGTKMRPLDDDDDVDIGLSLFRVCSLGSGEFLPLVANAEGRASKNQGFESLVFGTLSARG